MDEKPTDYTGGRTFWQFTFMDAGKIFANLFINIVCIFGGTKLLMDEINEQAFTGGDVIAWVIILTTLIAFWVMSVRTYRQLKKGISK